ncbi:MAG: hypothetical protein LQ342_008287 [Letrouitia transgressa]|nr:MAG: hypothetical protein LQ342_008287 [Letrouitia transgressa]
MTDHGDHDPTETISSSLALPHSFDSLTQLDTTQTISDDGLSKRRSIAALSRKLDDVEEILVGTSAQIPLDEDAKPALGKHQLCVSHDVTDSRAGVSPPASHHAAKIMRPYEDASVGSDKNSEPLDRYAEAMNRLRQRQTQHEQLHTIAISRIEDRDKRLIQLGTEMAQMQSDIMDDEAELKYLKLKLRIIEIQTLPYVPKQDQDGLTAGIRRWKLDWAEVTRRYRKRRLKRNHGEQEVPSKWSHKSENDIAEPCQSSKKNMIDLTSLHRTRG